jgi:MFS family permease
MGSVFYLGLFFGAIFAGFLSDTIGRRKTMIICTFVEVIVVMLTAFVNEFWQMMVVRSFYGFIFGSTIPLSLLFISEVTPKEVNNYKFRLKSFITNDSFEAD